MTLKTFLYLAYCYLTVVFTPIAPAILWLGFFIFVDLITGIWKARKAKEEIHSRKLSQTASKATLYFLFIICAHVIDSQFLVIQWLPAKVAQLVAGYLALVEFKSIAENISSLLGMPIWDYIKERVYRQTPKS